jgi:hypothetical protein
MNKDLKNRGLNAPVIVISAIIFTVIIGAAFVPGNAVYDASFSQKIFGYALIGGGLVFAWKSFSWLSGLIDNDKLLTWIQVMGTIIVLAVGFTILTA